MAVVLKDQPLGKQCQGSSSEHIVLLAVLPRMAKSEKGDKKEFVLCNEVCQLLVLK